MENTKTLAQIIEELQNRFYLETNVKVKENQSYITIEKNKAVSLITHLRDIDKFVHLAFLTAIDYIEQGNLKLLYMLHNYESNLDLGIYVVLPRKGAEMESIHHLWEQARTYQQELREMFGIDFPNSPGVDDPFILESWGNNPPPMLKDFDTKKYSEETFYPREGRSTKDPRKHMQEKLYPEDESV